MKRSFWTEEEIKILTDNLHLSNKELSNMLNRTENSINSKKKSLGLTKRVEKYKPKKGEIFKVVNELDGKFSISNYGTVINRNGRELKQFIMKSKEKKSSGYKIINCHLSMEERKTFRVHRLVAIYFVPNKENKPHVNHIDGNTLNNHYKNLEWCTPKENSAHAINTKLFNPIQTNKLSESDVIEICKYFTKCAKDESLGEICKKFNIHEETLRNIYHANSWKHITEKYKHKFVKLKYVRKRISNK